MKFEVINSDPRIVFTYKSISTNGQHVWKQFFFPARMSTILNLINSFFLGDSIVIRDELGILVSHDDVYEENDIILAVGVGSGISLIHNCSKHRKVKSFIGIDGSLKQIEIAIANAKQNGIDFSKFELIEGYVGNPTNIYGGHNQQSTKIIDINYMKFDVLELDCEGSEIEILRDLSVRPRHIIVEMHPMYRNIKIENFLVEMNYKGYNLEKIYTVNGDLVSHNTLNNYFRPDFIGKILKNTIEWGDGLLVLNFSLK